MSGSFRAGEEKERPGVYRRHVNAGGSDVAGAAENVGLAVVSGTWGPLNKPVITEGSDDVASIIGGGKGANRNYPDENWWCKHHCSSQSWLRWNTGINYPEG